MKTKVLCLTVLTFALVLFLGAGAEAQLASEGRYRGTFTNTATGTAYELEKGHIFFVGEFSGVFLNDVASGFIDKTSVVCPGVNDLVGGVATRNLGYCTVTDKDGDKAFLVWKGEGTGPNANAGDFQWTGGTGKFAGIKGNNGWRGAGIGDTPRGWVIWEGEWHKP